MTKRYFKATGQSGATATVTVFRASDTRVYASANPTTGSFSSAPASPLRGTVPAVEITASEYAALQALKAERLKARNASPYEFSKPSESWVLGAH